MFGDLHSNGRTTLRVACERFHEGTEQSPSVNASMLIKPLIFPSHKGHAYQRWHLGEGNCPPGRLLLVQYLASSASDCPGIISEGSVEEPVRPWEHPPRTLGPLPRAFVVHAAYLENLATMR